jgi:hypothetical protein
MFGQILSSLTKPKMQGKKEYVFLIKGLYIVGQYYESSLGDKIMVDYL